MRFSKVERGDALKWRMLFTAIRVVTGHRAPDVVRTLKYRQDFFGKHHTAHTQAVMRGESEWSVGEREIFAAYVSSLNECKF
jgi:hypothetical protein